MAEKVFWRGGKSASFFCLAVSVPPHVLEVTADLDKVERRVGRSGNDLGAGLTGCDGGMDERPREGFFASVSLLRKPEVIRELD
jgi:hypothetical protein